MTLLKEKLSTAGVELPPEQEVGESRLRVVAVAHSSLAGCAQAFTRPIKKNIKVKVALIEVVFGPFLTRTH